MSPWTYLPAADRNLTAYERNCSLERVRALPARLVQAATWLLLRGYLRRFHGLRVFGSEHLPPSGSFVIVANHTSHFDALVLGAALSSAKLSDRFSLLAAGDTFFSSPLRASCSSLFLNALPIWRRSCGGKALKTLRSRLDGETERGHSILGLFPEGTRSRTGSMGRFKSGVGALVAGTDVPVVPASICGAFDAWPPGKPRPGKGPITLQFGSPQTFERQPNTGCGWKAIAAGLESRVRKMQTLPVWTEEVDSYRPDMEATTSFSRLQTH